MPEEEPEPTLEELLEQLKDEDLTKEELKLIEQADEIISNNRFEELIKLK